MMPSGVMQASGTEPLRSDPMIEQGPDKAVSTGPVDDVDGRDNPRADQTIREAADVGTPSARPDRRPAIMTYNDRSV